MSDTLSVVKRHEEAALAALESATGGAPLCRVDGQGPHSVKSSEGAAVALADVRRALAHGRPEPSREAAEAVVADVRSRWSATAESRAESRGWQEYVTGGLEALDALEEELSDAVLKVPGTASVLDRPAVLDGLAADTGRRTPAVRWTRRRLVVAALVMLALLAVVGATVGWPLREAPLWTLLTAGAVVLSSLALALFVPHAGEGWRPDMGCAPCAAAGLLMAIAAPWLAIQTAPDGGRAALALVLGGAALARRLTEPPVCVRP